MNKYDRAIRYLTTRPEQINAAWRLQDKKGSALFLHAGERASTRRERGSTRRVGCLTQVKRSAYYEAETPSLTARIRADGRIPYSVDQITVADLPVFAEWQRKLDTYAFRRKAVKT